MNRIQNSINKIKDATVAGQAGEKLINGADAVYVIGKNTTKAILSTALQTHAANDIKAAGIKCWSSVTGLFKKGHNYITEDVG